MVVMDMLPAEKFEMLSTCTHEAPLTSLFDDISETLVSLHKAGYVHGNVHDTNIMVSTNKKRIMIIDFDWAGIVGQARYPVNMNSGSVLWRPDGAVDRALITAEHDMKMLDYIVTLYKKRHGTL